MSNYKSLNPTNEYVVQTKQARDEMLQQGILSIGDKVYVIADKKRYIVDFNSDFKECPVDSGGGSTPILESVQVEYTDNDDYTIEPSSGYDGISDVSVTVNVPTPQPSLEDVQVQYNNNNTYTIQPSSAQYDGIGTAEVTVNVQPTLQIKSVSYTDNNTYTIRPDAGYQGLNQVYVRVNVDGGGGGNVPPETPTDALIFYSLEPFSLFTHNLSKNWDGTLYYSTDYSTWSVWAGTDALTAVQSDGYYKLYVRGSGNTYITTGSSSATSRWVFSGSAIKCCGDINTLLDYSLTTTVLTSSYTFTYLFYGCGNVNFDVVLPATTLTKYCYAHMFYDCKSLTTAPALPATTLNTYCYYNMFQNCVSLTSAPALPATTLADYCYRGMFYDCKSLTTAPALPATTLAQGCYYDMFRNCTSLTSLPALPATILMKECYRQMFLYCSLIKISYFKTGNYQTAYRIPTSGDGVTATSAFSGMFSGTGGSFTDDPTINNTYYTSNIVIPAE